MTSNDNNLTSSSSSSSSISTPSSSSSRLELQKRLQLKMKNKTDTTSPRTHEQLPHFLQQVLPDNYTYIIKSYKELELENFPGAPLAAFDSTFYVNIASAEAIEEWRTAFHNKTGTIFRITRADKVKGIKVIYHKDFHCRHADIAAIKYMQKTYAQKAGQRRSRNTNCQCLAKIRLEKSRLILSHPCEIHLLYNHNHPLEIFNLTPPTPSMISSTPSDESGKSTPQHNLEFDSGEADYCHGIIKFMENTRRARTMNLSQATNLFNPFTTWMEQTHPSLTSLSTATNHCNNEVNNFGQVDIYGNEATFIGYPSPHDHSPHFQPQFTVSPTVHFSNIAASEQFIPTNQIPTMENETSKYSDHHHHHHHHHQYLPSMMASPSPSSSSSSSSSPSLSSPLRSSIKRPAIDLQNLQTQEIFSARKRRSTGVKRPEIPDMPNMIIGLQQQI